MSTDLLRQLRAAKQREYTALSSDKKPKVELCAHCQRYVYLNPVCPVLGKLHDLDKKKLIGGTLVEQDRSGLRSHELVEAIDSGRVKWEAARTKLVKADVSVVHIFQSYGLATGWTLHRYGILFGKYDAGNGVIEVHAIYEPPQHGNAFSFEPLPSDSPQGQTAWEEEQRVMALAQRLGLRRVGAILTHPPRPAADAYLTSRELLWCAREQSIYGDECVLLTLSPLMEGETGETAAGVSPSLGGCRCEAWQASRQCVRLFRMGVLSPKFAEAKGDRSETTMIHSSMKLEITEEKRDKRSGKLEFQALEPSTKMDTHWGTGYVAVERFESPIVKNVFMRRHRAGMEDPSPRNLRQYWLDPKRASHVFPQQVLDFQVLLYLLHAFGPEKMLGVYGQRQEPQRAATTLGGSTNSTTAASSSLQTATPSSPTRCCAPVLPPNVPSSGWAGIVLGNDDPKGSMRGGGGFSTPRAAQLQAFEAEVLKLIGLSK